MPQDHKQPTSYRAAIKNSCRISASQQPCHTEPLVLFHLTLRTKATTTTKPLTHTRIPTTSAPQQCGNISSAVEGEGLKTLLYLTKHHDIDMCLGVEVQLCALLTYALVGYKSLRFTPKPL
jgi:hypothetical protein